jgi:MoCo/4Fe-4S cofactor protein with predicted Tat translocation signal
MSSLNHDPNGYWKSLEELESGPVEAGSADEFPAGADPENGTSDPLSRRNFFQLMGASMALAGIAGPGCRRYETEEIVPLARRPEDRVPGNTLQYATAWEMNGIAQPLVATSYDGRPIKVDGNPEHPFIGGPVTPGGKASGGSSPYAQASILHLYDPDRSKSVLKGGKESSLEDFKAFITQARGAITSAGAGVRFLSEATSSPTVQAMKRTLLERIPGAQWHEWEPVSFDNERAGTKLAFGRAYRSFPQLDKAKTIVTLDGDVFIEHPAAVRLSKDYAKSRAAEGSSLGEGQMNRLWAVESTFTTTGAAADHRLPLRSELVLPFAMALDALVNGGAAPTAEFLGEKKVAAFLQVLAEELVENTGRAVVLAGRRQPAIVHALVARINAKIAGGVVQYFEDPEPDRPTHVESISALARDMAAGQVKALFILGGNPVYDAPADLAFADALAKVETSVHLSEYANETSAKTGWHLPKAHYLETWADSRTWDGTLTLAQPLIQPLYGGLSVPEALLIAFPVFGDAIRSGVDAVRGTIEGTWAPNAWRQAVHDGFVASTQFPVATPTVGSLAPIELSATQRGGSRLGKGQLEVVYQPSSTIWDGRFANNAWLQEIPDFLTKVTWDNYALVAPSTAKDLGIDNDTIIKVKVDGREIAIAAYTMPGQARDSIGLVLGGGRTRAGKVGGDGKKKVGFDVYPLRATADLDFAAGKATVTPTGEHFQLANTQEHWDIREGLDKKIGDKGIKQRLGMLVVETDAKEFFEDEHWDAQGDLEFFQDKVHGRRYSLFKEHEYVGHQWGMAVDLNQCTGCNACVIACQAENNIPVVGKDQVIKNREMHWLRMDRYFKGSMDEPEVVSQPVSCQQCELAPCEQVCPVGATTHSSEGLNDMAYNRCVGTRYCLNNCPYRARRFNFLDYNKEFKEARSRVRNLLFNPEVTVRHRGVMEKCTYCVQRIQNAKITAKNERRDLKDGDIVTACQGACASDAIVFGDLADKDSRVTKLHQNRRTYDLLAELNTRPRTKYMARVRNPNPKLVPPAAADKGHH